MGVDRSLDQASTESQYHLFVSQNVEFRRVIEIEISIGTHKISRIQPFDKESEDRSDGLDLERVFLRSEK